MISPNLWRHVTQLAQSSSRQAAPAASHNNKDGEIKVKMEDEVREKLRSGFYIIKEKKVNDELDEYKRCFVNIENV